MGDPWSTFFTTYSHMKSQLSLFLLVGALFAGCATAPAKLTTPSGRPEVVVANHSPDEVRAVLIRSGIAEGANLLSESPSSIVFQRPMKDMMGMMLYGSRYDSQPVERTRYTLVKEPTGTRIFFAGEIVTNPGSAFERITPADNYAQQQAALQRMVDDPALK